MIKASVRIAKPPTTAPSTVEVAAPAAPATPQTSESLVEAEVVDPGSPEASDQTQAVATRGYSSRTALTGDGIEGDWSDSDVKLPQFKIVNGSGPLSQIFANGEIILADETLLPPPSIKPDAVNPSIRVVPISLKRQWIEKLTQERQDAGDQGKIVYSLDEVYSHGGTTKWVGNERPDNFWEDGARCILLIEKPETSEHPGFALEFDGKLYAIAVYYTSGKAYRDFAKIIIGASQSSLLVPVLDEKGVVKKSETGQVIKRPLLWKNFWNLNFKRIPVGPKAYMNWYPVVKFSKDETSADIRTYCSGIAGNLAASASVE